MRIDQSLKTVRLTYNQGHYDAKVDDKGKIVHLCCRSDLTDVWARISPERQVKIQRKVLGLLG